MKAEATQEKEYPLHDAARISLLKETKQLKTSVSEKEADRLKERLKESKKNPDCRMIQEMTGYLEAVMAAVFAALGGVGLKEAEACLAVKAARTGLRNRNTTWK